MLVTKIYWLKKLSAHCTSWPVLPLMAEFLLMLPELFDLLIVFAESKPTHVLHASMSCLELLASGKPPRNFHIAIPSSVNLHRTQSIVLAEWATSAARHNACGALLTYT
mmetsp:Transcript_48820/g.81138  ORF Transcript_48820/g.81138 Transcript_48820/m.81138 type:complete len:109 (+) Transcript_48820:265-591(+)